MANELKLYPHESRSLLPLLKAHLPHTIVFAGTILANRQNADEPAPLGFDGDQLPPPLEPVYATFPPLPSGGPISVDSLKELGVGEFEWLVTIALPRPSEQIRIHHALVAAPKEEQERDLAEAERAVAFALGEMAKMYPAQFVVGDTHELFEPEIRRVVGGPKRTDTYIYVAPDGGFGHTDIQTVSDDTWEGELLLDHGRPGDAPVIFSTNKYRLVDYYASRAAYTTCLRPRPGNAPCEVWVMTHGDGSLGALWTQPPYRRRGLAKVVLAKHIAKEEARGVPGFCYIEAGNDASMSLFASLGWTPLPWITSWVHNDTENEH